VEVWQIILAAFLGWIALGLAAAQFCSMNTRSEEHDREVIDAAVRELRDDMHSW